ncbi:MAG: hypothetical protein ACK5Z1_00200, partial [Gemmatimonadota bacterium]
TGLAALGFLPAFSLEAAVTGRAPMGRGLRTAAYGASILAGAAQLAAAAGRVGTSIGVGRLALEGAARSRGVEGGVLRRESRRRRTGVGRVTRLGSRAPTPMGDFVRRPAARGCGGDGEWRRTARVVAR